MPINSKRKGKRGELAVAEMFKEYGYESAHRSAQFKGNTGQAADVEGIPGLHIEVKFVERMALYSWLDQAINDAEANGEGHIPVVVHKQNRKDVLVSMRFSDFMKFYQEWVIHYREGVSRK